MRVFLSRWFTLQANWVIRVSFVLRTLGNIAIVACVLNYVDHGFSSKFIFPNSLVLEVRISTSVKLNFLLFAILRIYVNIYMVPDENLSEPLEISSEPLTNTDVDNRNSVQTIDFPFRHVEEFLLCQNIVRDVIITLMIYVVAFISRFISIVFSFFSLHSPRCKGWRRSWWKF